ncbi:MAG: hypothetical protein ACOH1J_06590 [Microbacteriaceae bacterium]
MSSPYGQDQYQVRFEWGHAGAQAVSEGVQAIIWVDQLVSVQTLGITSVSEGVGELRTPIYEPISGVSGVRGSVQHAVAVARWALERQAEIGDRFCVAVIAAGEPRADGTLRFAVEDFLGAGAVVDALAAVGIDYCSPEAAAASAAYSSLRSATGHLVSASGSGQALGRPKISLTPVDELVFLGE